MLFTEPAFLLLFLPIVLALYLASPHRLHNHVLTLASVVFYAAGQWVFLPWLLGSTMVSYGVAIACDRWRGEPRARIVLVLGIALDLALLVVFKYAGFFAANLNALTATVHLAPLRVPRLQLPLGISFFTFHKISYKLDVARGTAEVRRNPLDLLLYILCFPQLIAGPIVRYHDIAGELAARATRLDDFAAGVRRFILGFGKKLLIANTVGLAADRIFEIPVATLPGGVAWLGAACYTLQIFVDFSAYSDMAIGLARMFGFHFPENFHYPYVATSITEFWRRWHISLSRWFRDYLYIPLGGNRGSPVRTYANLAIVFLLCGLWHGASWSFVVWGAFHGGLQIAERLGAGAVVARTPRVVRHTSTMLLVMIGWVIFRSETVASARGFLGAMFGRGAASGGELAIARYLDRGVAIALVAGVLASLPIVPALAAALDRYALVAGTRRRALIAGVRLAAVVAQLAILALGATEMAAGTYNPFIYFRF
jgi:alginate O-acetyltransferase complex protein AlgI